MHTPILIDTYYSKYLNRSNIEIINTNEDLVPNSHSYFSAYSFTKYNINLTLIQSDLSKKSVSIILEKLLNLKVNNPIFMPFGSSSISKNISSLLDNFDKNQVFCSFTNISDNKNFPSTHINVTPISSINKDSLFYFKHHEQDIFWYNKIDPIKIKTTLLNYNSFVLGDYYYASLKKLMINKKKEIVMPEWNFENNHKFEVKKNELFGFKITEDSSVMDNTIDGLFYEDGVIYGSVEQPVTITIKSSEDLRNFTIDPIKEDNYQFSILSKKF